jgi:autoinducer 2-degrading protein
LSQLYIVTYFFKLPTRENNLFYKANSIRMNQKPIYLFAKWQVQEGHLDAVLELLAQMTEKTRKEKGNLFYRIHQSISDANTLMLYEGYVDTAAVEAHRNADYFQNLVLGKIVPNLVNREAVLAAELTL